MRTEGIKQYDFSVMSNAQVARDVYRMQILAPELANKLAPGQFINIAVPGDPSHIVRLPLSFASLDLQEGSVELIYAVVGEGTHRLSQMGIGASSTLIGPCGKGWNLSNNRSALLVAGGVGAPPIVAAARELKERGVELCAILGARSKDRLWGESVLKDMGATVIVTTDDGSYGRQGFTTEVVAELLPGDFGQILTCGPNLMMAGVAALAKKAKIDCQASLERMMTCGFGACHTCNVAMRAGGYKFCCTDGPVFDAKEVAW